MTDYDYSQSCGGQEAAQICGSSADPAPTLTGRGLRFVLVNELRKRETLTVAEMVRLVGQYGFPLNGRPSKVISDSLRWEIARGRVIRLARGVYRYGSVPPTTSRRIKTFASQCLNWIDAVRQGATPPQTPPTPEHRKTYWIGVIEEPYRPPWDHLTWLWNT